MIKFKKHLLRFTLNRSSSSYFLLSNNNKTQISFISCKLCWINIQMLARRILWNEPGRRHLRRYWYACINVWTIHASSSISFLTLFWLHRHILIFHFAGFFHFSIEEMSKSNRQKCRLVAACVHSFRMHGRSRFLLKYIDSSTTMKKSPFVLNRIYVEWPDCASIQAGK